MIPESQNISVSLQEGYESRNLFSVEKANPTLGSAIKTGKVMTAGRPPFKKETTSDEKKALAVGKVAKDGARAERIVHVDQTLKLKKGIDDTNPLNDSKVDMAAV